VTRRKRMRPSQGPLTVLLTILVLLSGCVAQTPPQPNQPERVVATAADAKARAEIIKTHVRTLSNAFFRGRMTGGEGGRLAEEYVAFHLAELDIPPAFGVNGRGTTYFQEFEFGAGSDSPGDSARAGIARNVCGLIEGRGELRDEYVVLGAHLDHLGRGGTQGARPEHAGRLHPGADDNASGVAGLLLAASELRQTYAALPDHANARSVLVLAVMGEEAGLLGSRHFVSDPPLPRERISAALALDMIGRLRNNRVEVDGAETGKGLASILASRLESNGLVGAPISAGSGRSDHAAFHEVRIPALVISTGIHEDYHRPSDTADKVNAEGVVRVVDLVVQVAMDLARSPEPPEFRPPRRREW